MTDVADVILSQFHPCRQALLDWLRPRLDDTMLKEIAAADYGYHADEHLAELRLIRNSGKIPSPLCWEPYEVLRLTRWLEPDDPRRPPSQVGERGHLKRAFACAVLVAAETEPDNEGEMSATLPQLLASVRALSTEAESCTASLLAWIYSRVRLDETRAFLLYGMLLLAAFLGRERYPAETLSNLADWVVSQEDAAHQWLCDDPAGRGQWLLGLTALSQGDAWRSLTREMLALTSDLPELQVRAKMAAIAERVLVAA